MTEREHRGFYAVGAAAYLASCVISSVIFEAWDNSELDGERIGLISLGMALFALIPFLLLKIAMEVLRSEGLIAHIAGGSLAGVLSFMMLLGHGAAAEEVRVISFFAAWGAVTGLIYWVTRGFLKRMVKGSVA